MITLKHQTPVTREKLPIFEATLNEHLLPTSMKEMGFQAYEYLEGNAEYRKEQKSAFIAGEVRNPTLDYPKIDENELSSKISALDVVIGLADHMADPDVAAITQTAAAYHQIEMFWLMKAKQMDELKTDPTSDEFLRAAAEYQHLNETLYGKPKEEIAGQIYGEIMTQVSQKKLDARGLTIFNQLAKGTELSIGDDLFSIDGISHKAKGRLPEFDLSDLSELKEVVHEKSHMLVDIAQAYWDTYVLPRSAETDETPGFTPQDMKYMFDAALADMDPEGRAGIGVRMTPNGTSLSWSTPGSEVLVGGQRDNVEDVQRAASLMFHELKWHGGGMIKGLKSGVSVLGTGMYSDSEDGKEGSYLPFEEGAPSLMEMIIQGKEVGDWGRVYITRYLAAMSFYEGKDFRQTFEVSWRTGLLLDLKDGEPVTDEMVEKAKLDAYGTCVRIARGTPTELIDGPLLTYNKDLAYLEGKLIALEYFKSVKGNKKAIERLFTAKFDPTNKIQDALVTRYGIEDNGEDHG